MVLVEFEISCSDSLRYLPVRIPFIFEFFSLPGIETPLKEFGLTMVKGLANMPQVTENCNSCFVMDVNNEA